jgi:FkbM family methyltransferase
MLRSFIKRALNERAVNAVRNIKRALNVVRNKDTSQAGEVALLASLVNAHPNCERFLIDVGAHDGVTLSNSFPFIQEGWHALLLEPAPAVFRRLFAAHGHRPNVTCLQVACSDKQGEAPLYTGSDGVNGFLSTLCEDDNDYFRSARSNASIKVRVERLTDILRQNGAPARPGMLLIDTEGMDFEVLSGLDFGHYRPSIIVTEEYEWDPTKHAAKYSLLINHGYSLVQKIGCNTIWRDKNL